MSPFFHLVERIRYIDSLHVHFFGESGHLDTEGLFAGWSETVAFEEADDAFFQCLGRYSEESTLALLCLRGEDVELVDAEYLVVIG